MKPPFNAPDSSAAVKTFAPYADKLDVVWQIIQSSEQGLSSSEVTSRRSHWGANRLPETKPIPAWRRLITQFNNLLIYILLISALISFGLAHYLDTGVILGVVILNALVGFLQEGKAESALHAIRNLSKTYALVIRENELSQIDSEFLVPGDVVALQAGDRVPADLRLFYIKNLQIDESALTGESQPVNKNTQPVAANSILAERTTMAYMGTLVTYGSARGVVTHIGLNSELGSISELVRQGDIPQTPLQKQLGIFAQQLTIAIVLLSMIAMGFGILVHHYAIPAMFQAAIGIAVASIPEGLPAIVTIALAIGVRRMANNKALVRRLPSVEVLGSVDVICTDKTGTLTTNSMTARKVVLADHQLDVSGEFYRPVGSFIDEQGSHWPLQQNISLTRACLISALCNSARLEHRNDDWLLHGDPTEGALLALALKQGISKQSEHQWKQVDELPFDSDRRTMATLHFNHLNQNLLTIKGAPEKLFSACSTQLGDDSIKPLAREYWESQLLKLANQGMRVMALAQKDLPIQQTEIFQHDVESNLTLVALIGISDPPRAEAIESIALCRAAGIRIKMITGDNPITAKTIAKELGLNDASVLTGVELDELDQQAFCDAVETTDLFARTNPDHKIRLVNALQHQKHVVAMTGDGVNDAPALRHADIGVAMGKKGTDAAKEASDIVLTDDNFYTITKAVEAGRTVYDNIVKSILFILPTSLAEATIIIIAIISGSLLPITPAQILWINMVTTVTLSLALAFEFSEPATMKKPPRPYQNNLISGQLLTRILVVGFVTAWIVFGLFREVYNQTAHLEYARSMAINTLVMIEAWYLLNCRFLNQSVFTSQFFRGSLPTLSAIVAVIMTQLCFTYLPIMQSLFQIAPLSLSDWGIILMCSLPVIFIVELERLLWSWFSSPKT